MNFLADFLGDGDDLGEQIAVAVRRRWFPAGVTPSVRAGSTLQVTTTTSRCVGVGLLKNLLQHRQAARAAGGDHDGFGCFRPRASMVTPSLERSLNCSRCSCFPPWRRWEMRSTMMKTIRNVTRESDAPDRGGFLGQQVDQGGAGQDQEDGEDSDGDVDLAALVVRTWMLSGTRYWRGRAVLEAEERHGHGHEDERPDDAEGVGFAERVHVAEAGDDDDELQDGDEVDQAVGGAEAFVGMLEPGGEYAVLGQSIEHAVGADHAGVDGAGEDQKADDDDETFHDDFERPTGPARYWTRPLMRLSRYPPLSRWT